MKTEKNLTPDHYDTLWREIYGDQQQYGPVHRHMRRLLAGILAGISYRSVIDVGCGRGDNLPLIFAGRKPVQYTGIDISRVAISWNRRHFPPVPVRLCRTYGVSNLTFKKPRRSRGVLTGNFQCLDIERDYLRQKADLVFCSLLLEHVARDRRVIGHLRRMCRKWLVVTTIAGEMTRYRRHEKMMGHLRNYRPGELEEKLAQAGFRLVKVLRWGFPFYSPLVRYFSSFKRIKHRFSFADKLAAQLLYWLYYLNTSRRGDLLIILAKAED